MASVGHCRTLSDTVGLSDCRTVGLSDLCRTLCVGPCQTTIECCHSQIMSQISLASISTYNMYMYMYICLSTTSLLHHIGILLCLLLQVVSDEWEMEVVTLEVLFMHLNAVYHVQSIYCASIFG